MVKLDQFKMLERIYLLSKISNKEYSITNFQFSPVTNNFPVTSNQHPATTSIQRRRRNTYVPVVTGDFRVESGLQGAGAHQVVRVNRGDAEGPGCLPRALQPQASAPGPRHEGPHALQCVRGRAAEARQGSGEVGIESRLRD